MALHHSLVTVPQVSTRSSRSTKMYPMSMTSSKSQPQLKYQLAHQLCTQFVGLTARVDATNFDAIMKYTKRMPPEYQVIVVRDSLAKDRSLMTSQTFTKWTQENADVLL